MTLPKPKNDILIDALIKKYSKRHDDAVYVKEILLYKEIILDLEYINTYILRQEKLL